MAVCFFLAIAVAFSRMYLGVHTLIDVMASLLISFFFIFIAGRILTDAPNSRMREFTVSLCMLLYTVVVVIIAAVLYSSGRIEEKYLSDCLKAAGAGVGFSVAMYIERIYINFTVKVKKRPWQLVKFLAGFAGVLAIQEGLKVIIGTGLVIDMFRYFLMVIWAIMLFPMIIKRFFSKTQTAAG